MTHDVGLSTWGLKEQFAHLDPEEMDFEGGTQLMDYSLYWIYCLFHCFVKHFHRRTIFGFQVETLFIQKYRPP